MEVNTESLLKIIGEQTVEIRMLRDENRALATAVRRAQAKNAEDEVPTSGGSE